VLITVLQLLISDDIVTSKNAFRLSSYTVLSIVFAAFDIRRHFYFKERAWTYFIYCVK